MTTPLLGAIHLRRCQFLLLFQRRSSRGFSPVPLLLWNSALLGVQQHSPLFPPLPVGTAPCKNECFSRLWAIVQSLRHHLPPLETIHQALQITRTRSRSVLSLRYGDHKGPLEFPRRRGQLLIDVWVL